jgi:hypothetical protein
MNRGLGEKAEPRADDEHPRAAGSGLVTKNDAARFLAIADQHHSA